MRDPYFFDDCDVLRNKLGIKDEETLERAEVDISCNAIYEISISPLDGSYDFKHLCAFHGYIFKDIYDWAGYQRTVSIEKAEALLGHMSIDYTSPNKIEIEANAVLTKMVNIDWASLTLDEQAVHLTECLSELWKIHPFREGNTRTTITFVCQFAESQGMVIDRKLFERNAAYTRNALVASSAVFADGDFRKMEYLYNIVKDGLKRGRKTN